MIKQKEVLEKEELTAAGRKKVIWTKKKIILGVLFILIVLISLAVLILTFVNETFLFVLIRNYFILPLLKINYWAYLVFLILMILQSLIAPIPSELILLSAGMIFGLWPGVAIGVVGSIISGLVTYYLAIKGGRPILETTGERLQFADKIILVMDKWIESWGLWAIIAGRAVPVIMFDPISYAAGLSNIKWKPYALATFVGSIPRAIFFSFLGVRLLGEHDPDYIINLTPEELKQAAGQFNLIFYIIFGVLVIMLVSASILSNRLAKKSVKKEPYEQESKTKETENLDEKDKNKKRDIDNQTS